MLAGQEEVMVLMQQRPVKCYESLPLKRKLLAYYLLQYIWLLPLPVLRRFPSPLQLIALAILGESPVEV